LNLYSKHNEFWKLDNKNCLSAVFLGYHPFAAYISSVTKLNFNIFVKKNLISQCKLFITDLIIMYFINLNIL